MLRHTRILLVAALACAPLLRAQQAVSWQVKPEWVKADEDFLASDALQGARQRYPR